MTAVPDAPKPAGVLRLRLRADAVVDEWMYRASVICERCGAEYDPANERCPKCAEAAGELR